MVENQNETVKKENNDYYQQSAMQPIEVMQAIMTPEQFEGFLLGNIIKYRMRAKYKENYDKDMEKANIYAHWLMVYRNGYEVGPKEIGKYTKDYYCGIL